MVQLVSYKPPFGESLSSSTPSHSTADNSSSLEAVTEMHNPSQAQTSSLSDFGNELQPETVSNFDIDCNLPFHSNLLHNIQTISIPSSDTINLDNISSTAQVAFSLENECLNMNDNQTTHIYDEGNLERMSSVSSSGELFNSEYTDSITSCNSSDFLMKIPSDSEEEYQKEDGTKICETFHCNNGYMSCSSAEMLNESNDDSSEELMSANEKDHEKDTPQDYEEESHMLLKPESAEELSGTVNELHNSPLGRSLSSFIHHSLSPINEHEILSFAVKEVEPSKYGKITDNIVVVDESFLFNSEYELSNNKNRAATMHNIHERSSFLDLTEVSKVGKVCQKALVYLKDDVTLGSLISLNTALARENTKDPSQSISLIADGKSDNILKKGNYLKNLLALSFTITLLYTAVGSVRNLQSSINHEGGVGVIGLAANFFGYVIGSLFSSSVVQIYQPRKTLIVSLFPNVLYIAANFYPTMWIMVPISLVQGISLAIIANASSTYITFLAKGRAASKKQTFGEVSTKYFGTYSLLYISHLVIGNLVASVILQPPTQGNNLIPANTTNTSFSSMADNITGAFLGDNIVSNTKNSSHLRFCGPNFCNHYDVGGSSFSVPMETKALLFGVYIGCIVMAIVIASFFMEPLNSNLFRSNVSPLRKLTTQMTSLLKFLVDVRFLLLLPLLMHSTMHFAFLSAEFVKGYITCPVGIHMIGYTMICFGTCSSLGSYSCGLLTTYIGRVPFIVTALSPTLMNPLRRFSVPTIPEAAHLLSVLSNG